LIRADAVSDGAPRRDLWISPDHAVLLDGALIPARLLINGASIQRDDRCETVTYYHVELETHDILLAEALPAESYLDTGNRGMFDNADAPLVLHPDFDDGQARRVANSCRPLVVEPAGVEPVWRTLAMRAVMLGLSLPVEIATTDDPGLHIRMGERTIKPISVGTNRYTFVLPQGESTVRLVSRAAAPCDDRPWVVDRRRLGVMVSRLTLRYGAEIEPIPLDHPVLSRGWWGVERDRVTLWRWTNGNAMIPLRRIGPAVLEVVVTGSLQYPLEQEHGAGAPRGNRLAKLHLMAA
jgi:hypothetical protein